MELLSDICLDLEMSKKLKENGVKFDSLFCWIITLTTDFHISYMDREEMIDHTYYLAPTLQEMIELLPINIKIGIKIYRPEIYIDEDNGYGIRYMYYSSGNLVYFVNKNPLIAVAEMLVWCKKEGYLKESK